MYFFIFTGIHLLHVVAGTIILIVVVIISLILAGFDFVISWLVKLLLQN